MFDYMIFDKVFSFMFDGNFFPRKTSKPSRFINGRHFIEAIIYLHSWIVGWDLDTDTLLYTIVPQLLQMAI